MVAKTKKPKKGEMTEEQRQAIIDKGRQQCSALEKNLAIYENDLKRNSQTLLDTFAVDTIEEALAKVEELNSRLPGVQAERDQLVVEIQEYLTKHNL